MITIKDMKQKALAAAQQNKEAGHFEVFNWNRTRKLKCTCFSDWVSFGFSYHTVDYGWIMSITEDYARGFLDCLNSEGKSFPPDKDKEV